MNDDNVIYDDAGTETELAPADESDASHATFDIKEDSEPVVTRPMISIDRLVAHPGNVRRDLAITAEFVESFTDGVLVPFRITPNRDGRYRVIDGGRRLEAAIKAGLTEVPYDLVQDRADDEAGQYLDMLNTSRHRKPLTVLEEADALFAAKDAGATRTRIRKATGLTSGEVKSALAAAGLSEKARGKVGELDTQLSLDELAIIAEFDGDEDAVGRLTQAAFYDNLEHVAEVLRQARAEQAEHERIRGELEAAGYTTGEILPPNGQYLTMLCHGDEDLTTAVHADCPGRGALFRSWDVLTPVYYCAEPGQYGHALRSSRRDQVGAVGSAGTGGAGGGVSEPGEPDPSRRLVIQGNREWKAAAEVRKRWLAGHLFARRTAPREAAPFVARQLLVMPDPLRTGLAVAHSMVSFGELTGRTDRDWAELCDTASAGRLPLAMLAPIVAAFEHAMTDGEGRNTWRTDRYSPCPREQAGGYLRFLASVGYQPSAIEQAVAGQTAYTGEDPAQDQIGTGPDQDGPEGPEGPASGPDAPEPAPVADDGPPWSIDDLPGDQAEPGPGEPAGQAA
jgi:ParB family chromosome partitioning protein